MKAYVKKVVNTHPYMAVTRRQKELKAPASAERRKGTKGQARQALKIETKRLLEGE